MAELAPMFRGDSYSFVVPILDGAGAALDLTGLSLRCTLIRQPLGDVTIQKTTAAGGIVIQTPQSDPAKKGRATVTLAPADTSAFPNYPVALKGDVELTNATLPYTTEQIWLRVNPDASI